MSYFLFMANIITHPILAEIEAFIVANNVTPSVFGTSAVNDPCFVFDLRAGREPRRATLQKVVAFMRDTADETTPPTRQGKAPKKQAGAA